MTKKEILVVWFNEDSKYLKEMLQAHAKKLGLPMSSTIKVILAEYLHEKYASEMAKRAIELSVRPKK